ncbi:hypothetical protein D9615_007346 [Tricholomella constricta]|uniref:Endonuclease/exonuclease/phosphatase domain-containing protein n=1 Tax=Tricholomella constricta TaxID=117010 RepID=A0A8H5H559_9AGAR|nr:hypothetical protein D9615_007346 [Tricholomella constricta]
MSCPALAVTPPHAAVPSNFRIMAANLNGFASPVKLNAVRGTIMREAPHVFVLGETKSSAPVSGEFSVPEYQLFDAPGVSTGSRHKGKWGLLVGIKQSSLTVARSFTPPHLLGRVLVCDLILPNSCGHTIQHRVIALYAPWDPGGDEPDTPEFFWSAIADLCLESPFGFSLIGDFNAIYNAEESLSPLASSPSMRNQPAYTQFLHRSGAVDAWSSRPDRSCQRDWTFKSFSATTGHHAILDCLVVSQERLGSTVLVPRDNPRQPLIPPPVPVSDYNPRSYYPRRSERYRTSQFAQTVDQRLDKDILGVAPAEIGGEDDYTRLYHAYSQVLQDAACQHFQRPQRTSPTTPAVTNPTI